MTPIEKDYTNKCNKDLLRNFKQKNKKKCFKFEY